MTQAGGALGKFGLNPIEIKAGKKTKTFSGNLYSGMAQTLSRRIKKEEYQDLFKEMNVIIFDEAHKQSFNSLMPCIAENTIVIGATATPHRESNQKSLDDFYQKIVEVTTISELIELGFLSKPISYGVDVDLSSIKMKGRDYDAKSMGDKYDEIQLFHGVYENYMRLTPGKKAIIFAPNISSSMTLVKEFKEKGLPIHHIDGETPKKERREILEWFDKTPDAMLSNVGILNAGFDQPDIEVVILYRATKSLPLFLQMVGRGSRVTQTKYTFTILDFGNNIKRHGFWENDQKWSLRRKRKKEGLAPVKDCPSCFAILPAQVMTCEHCGHEFERTEKEEEEKIIAELQLLTGKQAQAKAKTASFEELELIAKAKNYKKGWVFHQLRTREQLEAYAKTKGYHKNWVNYQLEMRENQNAEL